MKKYMIAAGIITASALISVQANASCETFISSMSQKIQNNGVPADQFSLKAVPNSRAHDVSGKIIGNCNNANYQVVYSRKGRSYSSAHSSHSHHRSEHTGYKRPEPVGSASSVTPTGVTGNN